MSGLTTLPRLTVFALCFTIPVLSCYQNLFIRSLTSFFQFFCTWSFLINRFILCYIETHEILNMFSKWSLSTISDFNPIFVRSIPIFKKYSDCVFNDLTSSKILFSACLCQLLNNVYTVAIVSLFLNQSILLSADIILS